ncbi:bifunctional biotin--[acetyl-CoA-carboxylase] ligase/biotin operon repressor BirA [Luteimonas sp. 100069]|uniref:bifunctional biotin--[acetyl-CoA-carboxylase] ligase/biotin operon repressor BirA n=1 Tax=Luteimonas sp. 100069 TaxID=2006109 RepID=UPI000F4EDFA8|nr:bifunctional biotin--[acetyl-CoA-carboxylase] ligase/biotin operon repressor BirA [Luteimonas sp. 100069]RPD87715.1 bifunctional biotin--[acetyl-CoA-carboxylase] ligase/biotin operon repressor BirA [Luteimonas sp. 100069]
MPSFPPPSAPADPTPERTLLQRLIAGPVSGDVLARESGQTRAAVWKRISLLREAGVPIVARPGVGYALAQPLSLLDADAIRAALPADARARLSSLEVAWSVDSTNAQLLRRPMPGALAQVLLAERQTGGRGRRGREWQSPLGAHLYLSLQRGFEGGLARLGGLSLVAGVAAVEAIHGLGIGAVRLKWPNDLVVAGADGVRKLGGILVEGGGEHAGPARAVLGIGINVRMPEAQAALIDQPWTDLTRCGGSAVPTRDSLAAAVLGAWLPALDLFDREGLAPFRERYARIDALSGAEVEIHTEAAPVRGIAAGIADDGALQVEIDGLLRAFHAGEVSVRRTGAA